MKRTIPRIFLDTNILLDVLLKREDFYQESAVLFNACETQEVQGEIASISVNNVYYMMRHHYGRKTAQQSIPLLLGIFQVIPGDARVFHLATHLETGDYEDGIQLASAITGKASCLFTRNPRDFSKDYLPVLHPSEWKHFLHPVF
ncbi:MAG: PIN domain-containing protein [Victivallales bacterium]|nr:PIN domain-containing protein [Victivallales bacterium]